jgi:uncharacterized repeat protein (TIGR03943 family)
MNSILQRLGPAGILVIWGSVLCVLYFTGRVDAYLVPFFRPFTVVSGIVLIVLALLLLLAPAGKQAAGCALDRSLWKSLVGVAVLTVPLFVALGTSKDEFGASMVMNRTYVSDVTRLPASASLPTDALPGEDPTSVGEPEMPQLAKNANGDVQVEIIDLLYAAQLPDMRTTFENKQVEVIGQLMPARENNPRGDRYDVIRMFMTCCAADVQPIALPVNPAGKLDVPEMTWVKITGKATFPVIGGQQRPLIENATVVKTDPPEETYLY